MRNIIFDKSPDTSWFSPPSYEELVDSMEYDVITKEDIGSYQGDYLYFLKDTDRYGLLVFGYGSCSGCDSLQDCGNEEDVTSLRNDIESNIKWFDSKKAVIKFITNTEDKPFKDWYWKEEDADKFFGQVLDYCGYRGKKVKNGRKKTNTEED